MRGQYRGYVDEDGVHGGSDTETFVATRFEIESWRWAGVPWLIRAGKCLPVTATEAVVEFTAPPRLLFAREGSQLAAARTTSGSGSAPTTASSSSLQAKGPATSTSPGRSTSRSVTSRSSGSAPRPTSACWRTPWRATTAASAAPTPSRSSGASCDPVLDDPPPVRLYDKGTWGPSEADRLAADFGGWYEPLAPGEHPTG